MKQVSRELGVRYVLEGSVRRDRHRLRISAQLIDATTGGHHWAERYDRELGDIFAVQDEITRSVAAAIEPHLLAAEGVRALSRSADDLGAWELVARAQTHFWRMTRADYETRSTAAERAVEAYPDYAPARKACSGFCLAFAAHMGWVDRDEGLVAAASMRPRAIALDDRDPWGHIALGYWALMERRTGESIAAFRGRSTSIRIRRRRTRISATGSRLPDRTAKRSSTREDAIRLSPLDPMMALFLGRHRGRALHGRTLCRRRANTRRRPRGCARAFRARTVCAAQAWPRPGRSMKRAHVLQRCGSEQPQLSLDWIRATCPYQTPELMERFLEGMRKAGLKDD